MEIIPNTTFFYLDRSNLHGLLPKASCIYKIINLVNNKIYVGQTNNLRRRFTEHRGAYFNTYIYRAIKKYGLSKFVLYVIQFLNPGDNSDQIETQYIKQYNCNNPLIGYNILEIGNSTKGFKHSKEQKLKWSKDRKGHIEKQTTKNKISKSLLGLIRTQDEIEKTKKTKKENLVYEKLSKAVQQLDLSTGQVINTYRSIHQAAQSLGKYDTGIRNCVGLGYGKRRSKMSSQAYGYKWKLI